MNVLNWKPRESMAPEAQIALDMARRGLLVAPFWIALFALVRGGNGAASAAYGLAVALANLGLAALLATTFARISPAALGAATLAGYPVRLALVLASFFAVRNLAWLDVWAFGLTLGISHLGLLIWEARHVSLSFTYPALAPSTQLQETP